MTPALNTWVITLYDRYGRPFKVNMSARILLVDFRSIWFCKCSNKETMASLTPDQPHDEMTRCCMAIVVIINHNIASLYSTTNRAGNSGNTIALTSLIWTTFTS